jgi:hypothetical protein
MLQGFEVMVTDDNNPDVDWYMDSGYPPTVDTQGNTLTFYELETGSTAGTHSTITITITLSGSGACSYTWAAQPITYA